MDGRNFVFVRLILLMKQEYTTTVTFDVEPDCGLPAIPKECGLRRRRTHLAFFKKQLSECLNVSLEGTIRELGVFLVQDGLLADQSVNDFFRQWIVGPEAKARTRWTPEMRLRMLESLARISL